MSSTGNTICASWAGVVCVGREVEVTAGMYWTAGCEEAGTQAEEAWDVSDGDLSTPEGVELELVTSDLGETCLLPEIGAATCLVIVFSFVLGTAGSSRVGFLAVEESGTLGTAAPWT